ncbi:MAG TPA: YceI family protein [Myxococcaceae bacterium]|nr:YceI family protein [Myxococcaceae bacterium]
MARFRLVPEQSELWAEARSRLHPVRVHTAGLTGVVEAEFGANGAMLATPTHVELEARLLRSGHGLLDGELQRRLETRTYPRIRAELTGVVVAGDGLRLTGALTFHGVTRSLEVDVTVRQLDPACLVIEGARVIDMREFALPPPSFLMFKVQPEVQVRARLVAEHDA